jgi:hypothetical protein
MRAVPPPQRRTRSAIFPGWPFGSGLAIGSRDIPPISPRSAGHMKLRFVAQVYPACTWDLPATVLARPYIVAVRDACCPSTSSGLASVSRSHSSGRRCW